MTFQPINRPMHLAECNKLCFFKVLNNKINHASSYREPAKQSWYTYANNYTGPIQEIQQATDVGLVGKEDHRVFYYIVI